MKNVQKEKILPEIVISFILLISIFVPMFLHGLYPILTVYDILIIVLLLFVLATRGVKKAIQRIYSKNHLGLISIVVYFVTILISALINKVPLMGFVFNLQLSITFFIFWFICAIYLNKHFFSKLKNYILFISHINFIFVLVEYFILGYKQDLLGGIFGIYVGCNTLANVFMCLVCIVALQKYLNKHLSLLQLFIMLIENLLFAAFSEVKVFFVELAIIILLSVLFNKFSIKLIIIVVVAVLVGMVSIRIFYDIFPYYKNVFSIDGIIDSLNNAYSTNRGLTRGTGLSFIQDNFLTTSFYKWFGIGFGNVVYTSIPYIPTSFYQEYGYLKYNWFTHLYKFLETGWLGLLSFASFFIFSIFTRCENKENLNISKILGIICIIFLIYDTTLMNPYTMYPIACFLAMPYIISD